MPKWVLCVPLVAQWLWLGLRHGSLTLPSVVNPAIETGGLAGESKLAALSLIGPSHAAWVAQTWAVRPGEDADTERRAAGLEFPLVVKPDIGWCGYGVRRIDDLAALRAYAAAYPARATYLLQAFLPGPGEAGLFYVRRPGAARGGLVAIALRHAPLVVGDGIRPVWQLAAADGRLAGRPIAKSLRDRIPALGETVVLTAVASLRVGGRYEDAARLICPALMVKVDAVAQSMGGFTYGRFDVRFASEADLQAGRFQIMEVNGAGSEAIQFWDPRFSLLEAYAGVFRKQADLFALGAAWRAQGRRPVGVLRLARAWLRQQGLIRHYPPSN